MDDAAQAEAYAAADFGEPDERFVATVLERAGRLPPGDVVDLGCGPGNITLRLARALPGRRVVGIDGAASMLEIARRRRDEGGPALEGAEFVCARLPARELPVGRCALVVSNSLLHHLHDPQGLWQTVMELSSPGTWVFVGDLRRPPDEAELRRQVAAYANGAPAVLRNDFEASLRAAFELEEVESQLQAAGLLARRGDPLSVGLQVEPVGDRHLLVWGRLPE
jgi:trans-aconitate methyltransferase